MGGLGDEKSVVRVLTGRVAGEEGVEDVEVALTLVLADNTVLDSNSSISGG